MERMEGNSGPPGSGNAEEFANSATEPYKPRRSRKRKSRKSLADRETREHRDHKHEGISPNECNEFHSSEDASPQSHGRGSHLPKNTLLGTATTAQSPPAAEYAESPRKPGLSVRRKDHARHPHAAADASSKEDVNTVSPLAVGYEGNVAGSSSMNPENKVPKEQHAVPVETTSGGPRSGESVEQVSPLPLETPTTTALATQPASAKQDASSEVSPGSANPLSTEAAQADGKEQASLLQHKDTGAPQQDSATQLSAVSRAARLCVTAALFLGCLAGVAFLFWLQVDLVEVHMSGGAAVRGFQSFVGGRRLYFFLGIPYAQPPLHDLRFRIPRPVNEGSYVVAATRPGPPCAQRDWLSEENAGWEGSEDCLRLNVWTPCTPATEPGEGRCQRPVLVFLFAEGFQAGSNMRFDGALLAALSDMVVVAPNFRLGVLGFYHREGHDMPGNLALHDQEEAMRWLHEHVQWFGGDLNRTVLMGAGTGAWSLGAHLLSKNPLWRWRYPRLIMHSESAFRRVFSSNAAAFAEAIGCSDSSIFSHCVERVPLGVILDKGRTFQFGPNYESMLLKDAPWNLAQGVSIAGKEFLLGTVSNEGSPLVEILQQEGSGDTSEDYMREAVRNLLAAYGVNRSAALVELYVSRSQDQPWALSWAHRLLGDVLFECPLLSFAEHLSARGNRVYVYRFDYKPTFSKLPNEPGASRLEDLEFIFGKPMQEAASAKQERNLSEFMMQVWSTFIKNGSLPNVGGEAWPLYSSSNKTRVSIRLQGLQLIPDDVGIKCDELTKSFLPELNVSSRELK